MVNGRGARKKEGGNLFFAVGMVAKNLNRSVIVSNNNKLRLLRPAPDQLLIDTPVSPRENSVKNDNPECLIEAARLF